MEQEVVVEEPSPSRSTVPGDEVDNVEPEVEVDAEAQVDEAESTPAVETNDDEKTKDSFGDRIKELTDRNRSNKVEFDSQLYAIQADNERLRKELESRPVVPEAVKTLEDFNFDEAEYRSYLDNRTADIATKALQDGEARTRARHLAEQVDREFREKEDALMKVHADYQDVVYGEVDGRRGWPATQVMADELRQIDIGADLSYHLGKNPKVAEAMARLPSGRDQARAMWELESKLKAEKSKTGKKVSNAPPPPPKVKGGDPGLEKDVADMSDKEFRKWREKQIANR